MAEKVFITCAVTGSSPMPAHPNFPFRPDHVAAEALAAAEAGASIIHLHVRDRETGVPSQALDDYREVVGLIRQKNDAVILNVTTGPGCTWMQSEEDPAVAGPGTLMFTAERRLEQCVLLEAIAAAPRAHQFLKHGVGGEIDGFRAERIKPLKRDAGHMAAVQRL